MDSDLGERGLGSEIVSELCRVVWVVTCGEMSIPGWVCRCCAGFGEMGFVRIEMGICIN